jgi:hypothetical protein
MAAAISALNSRQGKQGDKSTGGCMGWLNQQSGSKTSTICKDPVSFHIHLHLGGNFRHQGMNSVQFLRLALDTASGSSNEKFKKLKHEHEALVKSAGTKFEVLAKICTAGVQGPTPMVRSNSRSSLTSFGESLSAKRHEHIELMIFDMFRYVK